ncbi:MAG TPA: hypothetical protein ENG01_01430 [Candidatus Aenigmarchaeota archaeon]|nr:hypothetical protein [Candidatus Aenigmarchaeota archaeon]HEX33058.1 hypothetical protein [Candidatus Aenigmarchaeota archaeon]
MRWKGIALMVGGTVGAGFLGIPYVVAKAGFGIGVLEIVLVGIITTLLALYTAEIIMLSKKHQLPSAVGKFLGGTGKHLMIITLLIGLYGALCAYSVGFGQTLASMVGGEPLYYSIAFSLIAGMFVYRGLKIVSKSEVLLIGVLIPLFVVITLYLTPKVEVSNITYVNPSMWALPFGVILFAFSSWTSVPETILAVKRKIVRTVIESSIVIGLLYLVFTAAFVGAFGQDVSEVATNVMHGPIGVVANLLPLFTFTTSYLVLGLVVKDSLKEAYRLNNYQAWILAILVPLAIVIFIKPTFIDVLSIAALIADTLAIILIGAAVIRARKTKEGIVSGGILLVIITIVATLSGSIIALVMR